MDAEAICWWCGAVAVDTEVVATGDGRARWLVIEWPDHPQDHEHSAVPPRPGELSAEGMKVFLRAMGAMD